MLQHFWRPLHSLFPLQGTNVMKAQAISVKIGTGQVPSDCNAGIGFWHVLPQSWLQHFLGPGQSLSEPHKSTHIPASPVSEGHVPALVVPKI